jgi:hypothetical protein
MTEATFCPATMCPLFASAGSPWTGNKNAVCPRRHSEDPAKGCAWYQGFGGIGCDGMNAASMQIESVHQHGSVLQIGPVAQKRGPAAPRAFDCPRAKDCQWQLESGAALCPPRHALSLGIDPRAAAW